MQEGRHLLPQHELLLPVLLLLHHPGIHGVLGVPVGDGVDEGVVVEGREVRVLGPNVLHVGRVVPVQPHELGHVVVEVGEGDLVLCPDGLVDDHLC